MKHTASLLHICACLLFLFCNFIVCPPVTDKPVESTTLSPQEEEDLKFGLEYERYLKEVVNVLESDESFRKKLEESNVSDIKSGEIARHLDFVGHGIRTRLDEIKRKEVDRLRQIIRLQSAMKNGIKDLNINIPEIDKSRLLAHLDHSNPNSFEVEDLTRLIRQATKDLEDIDEKRRSEFKNYEMEKEHLRKKELEKLDADKRAEEQKKFEEAQKKHADHPQIHHPGAEAQLQEVWEEADGLNKKDFDPRTFFYLHDTNGDGQLDEPEVEALFQKELDKVYDPSAPEDDMMERFEEMNRMREHVMNEVDKNRDKLISLEEFLESTKNSEFKKDEGWDTLEKQKVYSDEELAEFERQYEELQRQQAENQHIQPVDHLQGNPQAGHQDVNMMHQQQQQAEIVPKQPVLQEHAPVLQEHAPVLQEHAPQQPSVPEDQPVPHQPPQAQEDVNQTPKHPDQ